MTNGNMNANQGVPPKFVNPYGQPVPPQGTVPPQGMVPPQGTVSPQGMVPPTYGQPVYHQPVQLGQPVPPVYSQPVQPSQPTYGQPMPPQGTVPPQGVVPPQPTNGQPVPPVYHQPVQPAQPVPPVYNQPVPPSQPTYGQPVQPVYGQPVKKQKHSEAEGTIGKIVMAVLASIFLIASLAIFAAIVFPDLSDGAKLAVMYVISGIFFGVGFGLIFKYRKNPAVVTLLCCGTGMLYLTTCVGNTYYEILNQWVYSGVLIALSAAIAFIGRKLSKPAVVVGQFAAMVAFVAALWNLDSFHAGDALAIILAYYVIAAIYMVVDYEREYHKNWMHWVPVMLTSFVISLNYDSYFGLEVMDYVALGIAAAFILAAVVVGFFCYQINEKRTVGFGIYNMVLLLSLPLVVSSMFRKSIIPVDVCIMVIYVALLVAQEFRMKGKYLPGKIILQVYCLFMIMMCFVSDFDPVGYIFVGLMTIGLMLVGFLRDNRVYKIMAAFCFVVFLFSDGLEIVHFLLGLLAIGATIGMLCWKKAQYLVAYKVLILLSTLALVLCDVRAVIYSWTNSTAWGDWAELFGLVLFTAVAGLIPAWNRNFKNGKKEIGTFITACICSGLFMLTNLIYIGDNRGLIRIAFLALAVLLWTAVSVMVLLKSREGWIAFLVAIIWVILIVTCMIVYDVPGFLVSLTGILYAIFCIVTGFVVAFNSEYNYAPLRIFGLILVMLSFLKLLIFDINYPSMLARAASFFVAGVLCLGISLLYSFVEKKARR